MQEEHCKIKKCKKVQNLYFWMKNEASMDKPINPSEQRNYGFTKSIGCNQM